MKKTLAVLIVAISLVACNLAGDPEAKVEKGDSSTIQWLDSTHKDLGTLTKGQEIEIVYNFKNSGDKPLVISSVTPGCGCTVADYPKQPLTPGETGKIRAKFSSKGQAAGTQHKHISVLANSKPNPQTQLSFAVVVSEQ